VKLKDTARGTLRLDLHDVSLNEGRLTLNPLPVAGADGADGRIEVQEAQAQGGGVEPGSTLTRLLGRLKEALLGQMAVRAEQAVESTAVPTLPILATTSDSVRTLSIVAARPAIELNGSRMPATGTSTTPNNRGNADWRSAFVANLGRAPFIDPNGKLTVSVAPDLIGSPNIQR